MMATQCVPPAISWSILAMMGWPDVYSCGVMWSISLMIGSKPSALHRVFNSDVVVMEALIISLSVLGRRGLRRRVIIFLSR